uniref:Uncharacterized protein n=1 Tax=Rhizophora mucronata TaxID=61149 RepID=A0A2P2IY59_RHIMU
MERWPMRMFRFDSWTDENLSMMPDPLGFFLLAYI